MRDSPPPHTVTSPFSHPQVSEAPLAGSDGLGRDGDKADGGEVGEDDAVFFNLHNYALL